MFGLKALSLSPNPCTPKYTLTHKEKNIENAISFYSSSCEHYLFLFFFL
jgi:hypothetical protein